MSAPRTVSVRTQDHGRVTFDEPVWCIGHPTQLRFRQDIEHQGTEVPLLIHTEQHGEQQFLRAYLVQRPFSGEPQVRVAFGDVDVFPFDSAGLRDIVDAIVIYALGALPALIRQLERIESAEGQA